MLSALLIQLFGRDVIDRLSAAGFATSGEIASAGAERLSEQGGIPVALARRIIAVAMEDPGDADPPAQDLPQPIPDATSEAPASGDSHDHHVRRPFKRPHSPLAADAARVKEPGSKRKRARRRPEPESEPGPDPFVDDVGLVSWMGSAARGGPRAAGPFAVADEILDPGPAILDAEPEAGPGTGLDVEPDGRSASRLDGAAVEPKAAQPPAPPVTPRPQARRRAAPQAHATKPPAPQPDAPQPDAVRPAALRPPVPPRAAAEPPEPKHAEPRPAGPAAADAKQTAPPLPPAGGAAAGSASAGEARTAREKGVLLVEESFWSFGVPKKPGQVGRAAAREPGGDAAHGGSAQGPRRRSHDGH